MQFSSGAGFNVTQMGRVFTQIYEMMRQYSYFRIGILLVLYRRVIVCSLLKKRFGAIEYFVTRCQNEFVLLGLFAILSHEKKNLPVSERI